MFVNGEILPRDKAVIPVYDLGLLRGMGVFDFFRVWDGVPVFVEDHIERLQNSLEVVGIHVDYTAAEWLEKIREMIRVNQAEHAGFRIVVTGGFSEDGYSIPEHPNVYMMLHYLPAHDPKQWDQGVSLVTSHYQRDMPQAKTTIYVQSMKMQPVLKKTGAFEVLYHWNNKISECSRCNIFFIDRQGVLHTPANSMLKGITRKQVLKIAAEHGMAVIQREIDMSEIPAMAGAFLTATTKGVLPVVKIDDQVIGDGRVHPLCKTLNQLFEAHFEKYIAAARLAQMVL
jgi:D-alanine transaminase/branched-chain amino acid aminotransferase